MKKLLSRLIGLYLVAMALLATVVLALALVARFRDAVPALVAVLLVVAVLRIVWMRTRW